MDGRVGEEDHLCQHLCFTIRFQPHIVVIALVGAVKDDVAFSVVGNEGAFSCHTVVAAVIVELEPVVGEVLWCQFRITLDDNITRTPASLPGADDNLTEPAAIIIASAAGKDK